ncbi:type-F conjugative transfer system pilin assembly protein TraF [Serratia proteamaculans]|uniref:type-F conjugative transfer system pilin assembly protein TraF n=1 Tax=Serratia proteamaculans TaxID=28151 RepID=UPI0039BE31AC
MKKILFSLLLLSVHTVASEEILTPAPPFTGYFWYNEPKPKPKPPKPKPEQQPAQKAPSLKNMTPTEQAEVLKQLTQDSLNKAILYPSSENTARFLRWQKFWTDRASQFSQSFSVAQLDNPELDYNLEYSHYNSTAPLQQAKDQQAQVQAIHSLSGRYGLFYFYRGKDPQDVQMAGVVMAFAQQHNISLIPVSVDGQVAASLPDSRPDNGQSQALNIRYFPALYLVDPKSRKTKPLVYGFMTQDDLAKRFLNVATGFKPNF